MRRPGSVNFLIAAIMALSTAACSGVSNSSKTSTPPPSANGRNTAVSASPAAASNSGENTVTASEQGFKTTNICTLPRSLAAPGSGLGLLGGGNWEKWDEAGGDLSYGCSGGLDSVKLEDVVAKISVYYTALGEANAVHRVSVKYVALQYGGKAPVEKDLRQQYVRLCGSLGERFYGEPFSEKFKRELSDEAEYSATDKPSESFDTPGSGYVTLSTSSTKEGMMTIETTFFPSESEYKKFKDL